MLKEYGNHVQILTKGDGSRDFDLLDGEDWYGITYSGADVPDEPGALEPSKRLFTIAEVKSKGIKTWVSFEPVVNEVQVLWTIRAHHYFFDKAKIGKLNYHPSDIDWAQFGWDAVAACREMHLDYYIKDSLRAEKDKP